MKNSSGFTLIELLIVMVILAALSGMTMTMISQVKRSSMKSSTLSVEKKVETALRLFKDEYSTYPYQTTYPRLDPNAANQYFPNNLYYHVGTDIASGDSDMVLDDVNTAKAEFAYSCLFGQWSSAVSTEAAVQPSVFTFTESSVISNGSMHVFYNPTTPYTVSATAKSYIATLLDRMAMEWVTNAMIAGADNVKGFYIFDQFGAVVKDTSTLPILSSPESAHTSSGVPGWANDYLGGDIDPHYVKGMDILDAWHNPLIYICQALPGVKGSNSGNVSQPFDSRFYGLGPQGFDPTTGPVSGLNAVKRHILMASGRICLDRNNAGDSMPTPADTDAESAAESYNSPAYFPDASNLMQSDMRYYAPLGQETEFELWSAGYDGKFSYIRSDAADGDNICASDLTRALK